VAFGRRATRAYEKREGTWTNLAANLVVAVDRGTLTCIRAPVTDMDVSPGTHVNSIYVEMNVAAETVTNPKVFHWALMKNPTAAFAADPSVYNANTKSWIIKRGMEMLPKDTSTVYKRIFAVRVPKKMRRMSEGDIISLRVKSTSTETINFCGFALYFIEPALLYTYKEKSRT